MKVKIYGLTGKALDYAVALTLPDFSFYPLESLPHPDEAEWVLHPKTGLIEHYEEDQSWNGMSRAYTRTTYSPSTNREQGGKIIDDYFIATGPNMNGASETEGSWFATAGYVPALRDELGIGYLTCVGWSRLEVAMRAFVMSMRKSEDIDLPDFVLC